MCSLRETLNIFLVFQVYNTGRCIEGDLILHEKQFKRLESQSGLIPKHVLPVILVIPFRVTIGIVDIFLLDLIFLRERIH